MNKPDCNGRVPFGAENAVSPNPGMLKEFADWARDCGVLPHKLVTGERYSHEPNQPKPNTLVDEVWVLRPPTEGTRYQKPQSGIACTTGGQLYEFETGNNGFDSVVLSRRCPMEGRDAAVYDEMWVSQLLDGAEANLHAASEAKMSLTEYMNWAQTRQAAGTLAVAAA